MKINKTIVSTLSIQAFGIIATFLTNVIVSRLYGSAGQGEWTIYKSIVDLVVCVISFGFPATIIYFISNNIKLEKKIKTLLNKYTLIASFFLIIIIYIAISSQIILNFLVENTKLNTIYLSVAIISLMAYGFIRSLALATCKEIIYNYINAILPVCTIMILLTHWFVFKNHNNLLLLFALSGLFSYIISLILYKCNSKIYSEKKETSEIIDVVNFFKHGGINLILNALNLLTTYFIIDAITRSSTLNVVGLYSIMLLIVGVALIPMNIYGPILYSRWMKLNDVQLLQELNNLLKIILIYSLIAVILMWLLMPTFIRIFLGNQFIAIIEMLPLVYLTIPFSCVQKIAMNVILVKNKNLVYVYVSIFKILLAFLFYKIFGLNTLKLAIYLYVLLELFVSIAVCSVAKYKIEWKIK